jgi:hypothetical protein
MGVSGDRFDPRLRSTWATFATVSVGFFTPPSRLSPTSTIFVRRYRPTGLLWAKQRCQVGHGRGYDFFQQVSNGDWETVGVKAVVPGVGFVPEPKGDSHPFDAIPEEASVWL